MNNFSAITVKKAEDTPCFFYWIKGKEHHNDMQGWEPMV